MDPMSSDKESAMQKPHRIQEKMPVVGLRPLSPAVKTTRHTQNILRSFRPQSLKSGPWIFYWKLTMSSCAVLKRSWHPEQVVRSQPCDLLEMVDLN